MRGTITKPTNRLTNNAAEPRVGRAETDPELRLTGAVHAPSFRRLIFAGLVVFMVLLSSDASKPGSSFAALQPPDRTLSGAAGPATASALPRPQASGRVVKQTTLNSLYLCGLGISMITVAGLLSRWSR